MRLVIARCQVDYAGRLTAHLPMATRLILVKADGSVSIHADDRAYKPLNWMSPPCTMTQRRGPGSSRPDESGPDESPPEEGGGDDGGGDGVRPDEAGADHDEAIEEIWEVRGRDGGTLQIAIAEVLHDSSHELGADPGLRKDGVEAHLQALLAEHPHTLGSGWSLVRREYMTAIGPVDLLCRDDQGGYVAVEIKRRGEIDGVEQLTRYLDLLRRDPLLGDVRGLFAAQQIKPQAKVLASDRGIGCLTVDYDALRGLDDAQDRLF